MNGISRRFIPPKRISFEDWLQSSAAADEEHELEAEYEELERIAIEEEG